VRRSKYRGGWTAFVADVPNATFCADDEIARVGFMSAADVEAFIEGLQLQGLSFLEGGKAIDVAVVDQQRGLTTQCDWLEFGKLALGAEGKVAACWFFEGPRIAARVYLRATSLPLATPVGWEFEGSLSQKFDFVPNGEEPSRLKFLRNEGDVDVYLDLETGKEVFLGRTR
jgi:hypothetical protein